MSVTTELENYVTFLTDAYNICEEKGAKIPEDKNLQNLKDCINSISGGLDNLGTEVTVEAQTTIDAGDRIVGIKNGDYVTPTLASMNLGFTIDALSQDESVGLGYTSPITDGITQTVFFRNNDGSYDAINITFENLNGASFSNGFKINDDGTLAMCSNGLSFLILDINKTNRSISYHIENIGTINIETTIPATYSATLKNCSLNKSYGVIVGNYVICSSNTKVITISTGQVGSLRDYPILTIFKYVGSLTLKFYSEKAQPVGSSVGGYTPKFNGVRVEDNIIFTATNSNTAGKMRIYNYSIGGNSLKNTSDISNANNGAYLSKNGRYIGLSYTTSTSKICSLNSMDLSMITVKQIATARALYPNNEGSLALTSEGVYDVQTGSKIYNGGCDPISKFFDKKRWVSSSTIYTITPATNAEYLISKITTFEMETNKMYGVASESLTVGMQGTARELFNTYEEII